MEVLKVINALLEKHNINYSFGMYNKTEIVYPYFVGEYNEEESFNEDGIQDSTFILNGFTRNSWSELENIKNIIKNLFPSYCGKIVKTSKGFIAIYYISSIPIPQDDAELKRIQINLRVKELEYYEL